MLGLVGSCNGALSCLLRALAAVFSGLILLLVILLSRVFLSVDKLKATRAYFYIGMRKIRLAFLLGLVAMALVLIGEVELVLIKPSPTSMHVIAVFTGAHVLGFICLLTLYLQITGRI